MKSCCIRNKIFYHNLIVFSLVYFCTSCITSKDVKYLQDYKNYTDSSRTYIKKFNYLVQPGDYLNITFSSIRPEINAYINLINPNSTFNQNLTMQQNKVFIVNDSGFVELPQTGKIYVKDLNTEEIKSLIENKINYKNVVVTVLLSNFTVTVVGEVSHPGRITIDNQKITIFELIGMCGDLTLYADRKNIKLVRETQQVPKFMSLTLMIKISFIPSFFTSNPMILFMLNL